jgi:hypothetical protein
MARILEAAKELVGAVHNINGRTRNLVESTKKITSHILRIKNVVGR